MSFEVRLPRTDTVPLREHKGGYSAEGPGWYIWDEDPDEVLRMAHELERGNFAATPTMRLMVLR